MPYALDEMARDIRAVLARQSVSEASTELCQIVARALTDDAFVATHLKDRPEGGHPREVLYEDPDLGFCICGHVYEGAAESGPHDHGSSWAIYGQADGETEMTDWTIVEEGSGDTPARVTPAKRYTLRRGDAYFYDVGDVHSPRREQSTRLVRVEGANLDHVKRSLIEAL